MKNKELANTVQEVASPLDIKKKKMAKEDLTGREQMVSNVIFNWAGHFVFIQ